MKYFPILLKNQLPKKYYDHALLGICAMHYLSNKKVYDREIDHAEELFNQFSEGFGTLYGKNRITYNQHVTTHVAEYVRMYGPSWNRECNDFKDFNSYAKDIIHGTNKIDAEIVNTFKICYAYRVLGHILNVNHVNKKKYWHLCQRYFFTLKWRFLSVKTIFPIILEN